jgi:alpha-3'-ketoglucosidase
MKTKIIIVVFSLALLPFFTSCKSNSKKPADEETKTEKAEVKTEIETPPNSLSQAEKDDGWVLLFDGKTSKGWRGYKKDYFPSGWKIENGTLRNIGSGRGEAGNKEGGDIIYDKEFQNFDLTLEWKISKGGNSGIFYLGKEDLDYIWKTAPEMQVLDNENHPDAKLGINSNRQAGSLYDLIPANPQNAKPVGEWNKIEIIVYNGTVVHKMNGETVVEYHLWTPEWNKLVAGSKFPKLNPNWADVAKKGYFGLQDHGDDVWFRNIKIKELD